MRRRSSDRHLDSGLRACYLFETECAPANQNAVFGRNRMLETVIASLDRVGSLTFWVCAIALLALDTAAVVAVIGTKSRELVNRWTSVVLGANLVLIGAGVGVPSVTYFAASALRTFAPAASSPVIVQDGKTVER
jgi:hypothetical protein